MLISFTATQLSTEDPVSVLLTLLVSFPSSKFVVCWVLWNLEQWANGGFMCIAGITATKKL